MRFFKIIAAFLALHLLPVQLALAAALTPPAGEVILEINGAIGTTNQDGAAVFDLAMLEALTQRETITATPWYDGVQTFSGPTIADLMTTVGATGGTLRVIAINDYAVEMPMADVSGYPVILATRHNGEPMSVRDKGPLFVIYPFDEFPDLVNEVYFARSVWQVKRIEVLP
ncbi:hypothetical protein [Gemmobacter denitrificans]|uniref:Oxidoreductase molybdopterin-binding domain-containing protein n=1 Tax=Gemmobacter denitrificans TaxID=3123040 RepID=A0ABU8BTW6_9RHOB